MPWSYDTHTEHSANKSICSISSSFKQSNADLRAYIVLAGNTAELVGLPPLQCRWGCGKGKSEAHEKQLEEQHLDNLQYKDDCYEQGEETSDYKDYLTVRGSPVIGNAIMVTFSREGLPLRYDEIMAYRNNPLVADRYQIGQVQELALLSFGRFM